MATAQEKLKELEKQKEETMKYYSPASLLHRLQGKITIARRTTFRRMSSAIVFVTPTIFYSLFGIAVGIY